MRIALAFGRPDVDRLMEEVDFDTWNEWRAFFETEPTGWQATNLMIRRITWALVQVHSKRKLNERDFEMRFKSQAATSVKAEFARAEAAAIRSEIEHRGK